ncbi:MAG TPA: AMP-binding protein, partial [Acidimicrobiales bacterium]|nr:AMP-binding protein [Acidimicrobiales bacterium]
MQSTMQDAPLLVSGILRHGQRVYGDSLVITVTADGYRQAAFAEVAARAEQLAKALSRLGVADGDRVGTFMWNDQEHLEAYFAIPSMGAVLHTLNIRLFPEQLAFVVNDAEDKVVIVDASVAPLFARVRDQCKTVEKIIVVGGPADSLGDTLDYDALVGAEEPAMSWPELDERSAAAMCYTSGTTGDPKGVVYSHRSTYLHSMSGLSANGCGASERDRVLAIVPMFHANAWGIPYTAFLAGADLVMPERFLQAEPLARM